MGQDEEEQWGKIGEPDASHAQKRVSRRLLILLSLPVILVVCCGVGGVLAVQSWLNLQSYANTVTASLEDIANLQAKVAREFSLSSNQVAVQQSRQIVRSGRGSEDVTTLEIRLENSPFSEMSETDRRAHAQLVADLARRQYLSIGSVSQICVVVTQKSGAFGISSSRSQRYCWPAGVPKDNSG